MKNRAFIYLLALLLLVGFILSWYMVVIIRTNMQFQNTGEKLINEIECYQQAYGVLPEEMQVLEWGYEMILLILYISVLDLMNIISTIQSKRNGMTSHNFKF